LAQRTSVSGGYRLIDNNTALASVSLFAGGGIGDLGIRYGCGIPVVAACELDPKRAGLIRHNHPGTKVFEGDIVAVGSKLVDYVSRELDGRRPWLVTVSPPCQGMSTNGQGRLAAARRKGTRPQKDARNELITPGLDVICQLRPSWVVIENVPGMFRTSIQNENDELECIPELIQRRLHALGYLVTLVTLEFADFGVPQRRERLIIIACRIPEVIARVAVAETPAERLVPFHPHADKEPAISLREAIGHLPALDSLKRQVDPKDPLHAVPAWREDQYFWMASTREGESAFDNRLCVKCGHIHQSNDFAVCETCDAPLPVPQTVVRTWQCHECLAENSAGRDRCHVCTVERDPERPLIETRRRNRGFQTSYKRLRWDRPAGTVTKNSGVVSSDRKGHPDQHRVLSIRELMIVSAVHSHPGTEYPWDNRYHFICESADGIPTNDALDAKLAREVLGECVPPLMMARIVKRLFELDVRI
jgi:DNA (cytosine-5)-methyltransferase 1